MRVRFLSTAAVLGATLGLTATAFAQPPAPRETVSATVGGKKVSVEYGRPSLKGRTLDSLVTQLPEDRMWRAGVDQVTTLTTEGDVLVGGKKVAAGKYSIYVHAPQSGPWSIAINSDQGVPLGKIWDKAPKEMANEPWPHLEGYTKNIGGKEVARAPMTKADVKPAVEQFTITMKPAGAGATMTLAWGDRSWSVPVEPAK